MNIGKLRECFRYNEATGELIWKSRPISHFKDERSMKIANSNLEGKVAGTPQKTKKGKTYLYVRVGGKSMLVHRVCYALVFGDFDGEIDHINGNGTDNRIINLRAVSRGANSKNQRLRKTNTSGRVGVTWHKAAAKWHAQIMVDGKNKSLGLYSNKDDAIKARSEAEIEYGFHINHGTVRPL